MSHRKLLQQMIGVTLVMLLLVGCGAPGSTPVPPTSTPTPIPPTATPVPPTLTATLPPPTPTLTPIPTSTTGIIRGRLVHHESKNALGDRAVLLHPAQIEESTGRTAIPMGDQVYLGTQLVVVSETRSDEQGFFVFDEVLPGSYALSAEIDIYVMNAPARLAVLYTTDGQFPSEAYFARIGDLLGLAYEAKVAIISLEAG